MYIFFYKQTEKKCDILFVELKSYEFVKCLFFFLLLFRMTYYIILCDTIYQIHRVMINVKLQGIEKGRNSNSFLPP